MTISMSTVIHPTLVTMLGNQSHMLDKAQDFVSGQECLLDGRDTK